MGRYGLPRSVCADKASIYRTTRDATVDENLADTPSEAYFGRARKELGVKLILTHSPQAKGRVERRNTVLQNHPLAQPVVSTDVSKPEAGSGEAEIHCVRTVGWNHSAVAREESPGLA